MGYGCLSFGGQRWEEVEKTPVCCRLYTIISFRRYLKLAKGPCVAHKRKKDEKNVWKKIGEIVFGFFWPKTPRGHPWVSFKKLQVTVGNIYLYECLKQCLKNPSILNNYEHWTFSLFWSNLYVESWIVLNVEDLEYFYVKVFLVLNTQLITSSQPCSTQFF